MKRLFGLLLIAMACHAHAMNPVDYFKHFEVISARTVDFKHFEVIGMQTIDDDKALQFLADVAGAVRMDWDFRPTKDVNAPLYRFKNLTYFLQNGERFLGYAASTTLINCHDKTSSQGPVWYASTDEATPMLLPPKSMDFVQIDEADVFYPVAQRLCQW